MRIGIDGSRAFLKNRTGIEEYSYQVTKHLRDKLRNQRVVLYIRKNQEVDFELPANWQVKKLWLPYFSSQLRFSLEFLLHPIDVLLVPAHTVPPIHPKKTVVVVHGLEYEFVPEAYSGWARFYMRTIIKNSCKWASKIIAVSENTKKDLIKLYGVKEEKIQVVHEGYASETGNFQFPISNFQKNPNSQSSNFKIDSKFFLFIGRIEERKNIVNIIKAFEILKEKYQIPHKLVLAGKPGFGFEKIQNKIQETRYKEQIIQTGFITEEEKWELLQNAEAFVFPTKYEGFGIPLLEAQSVGCPVVASNNSSVPEVVGESALLVDPEKPEEIAEALNKLISDEKLKNTIITKGLENVQRFSWEKCAEKIAKILVD